MLNPSTADALKDDATIRRCIHYAKREGCERLDVVNLFALRSTDPKALYSHPEPVGIFNDKQIFAAAEVASKIILAWGAHGGLRGRGNQVLALLRTVRPAPTLWYFGATKEGEPRHPLRLANDAPLYTYWQGDR